MVCIIVIGMTRQGKSTFVKKYIDGKNCLVFDVQNEYNLSDNNNDSRSRVTDLDEKKFVEMVKYKRNTVCVFEEATCFFEGRLDRNVRRIVISKAHTGNVFIFCFHSVSSVPPRLKQICDFIILFKTGDEVEQVQQKFPSLVPYFEQAKTLERFHYLTIKNIQQ